MRDAPGFHSEVFERTALIAYQGSSNDPVDICRDKQPAGTRFRVQTSPRALRSCFGIVDAPAEISIQRFLPRADMTSRMYAAR